MLVSATLQACLERRQQQRQLLHVIRRDLLCICCEQMRETVYCLLCALFASEMNQCLHRLGIAICLMSAIAEHCQSQVLCCAVFCCTNIVVYCAIPCYTVLYCYTVVLQLLERQGKEEPVSIRKLDTVEEVLKESDVSFHLLAYKLLAPGLHYALNTCEEPVQLACALSPW